MIEDPIYDIVRKRKLNDSFKTIVNKVSSMKKQKKHGSVVKHGKCLVKPNDFHERQFSAHCGLHSIHNLFRNSKVTRNDLDSAAKECASESGDNICNHKHVSGYWSMDAIIRCLEKKGFQVKRGVTTQRNKNGKMKYIWDIEKPMYDLLEDENVYGFIIHEPFHYTCYRKTKDKSDWEYSNSYSNAAQSMNPKEFCKQALAGVWNIFLVSKIE